MSRTRAASLISAESERFRVGVRERVRESHKSSHKGHTRISIQSREGQCPGADWTEGRTFLLRKSEINTLYNIFFLRTLAKNKLYLAWHRAATYSNASLRFNMQRKQLDLPLVFSAKYLINSTPFYIPPLMNTRGCVSQIYTEWRLPYALFIIHTQEREKSLYQCDNTCRNIIWNTKL